MLLIWKRDSKSSHEIKYSYMIYSYRQQIILDIELKLKFNILRNITLNNLIGNAKNLLFVSVIMNEQCCTKEIEP